MRIAPMHSLMALLPATVAHGAQPLEAQRQANHHSYTRDSLTLRPQTFALWWLALVALHVVNALATLAIAQFYLYIAQPDIATKFDPLQVSTGSLRCSGYSFAVVAAAHSVLTARILVYSLYYKQLTFGPSSASDSGKYEACARPGSNTTVVQRLRAAWHSVRRYWGTLFGRNGYFGTNGAFFDAGFEVREAIEIVLQTYQAYYLSKSVPKRWINSLAVMTIVLNCCATPLAHVLFRERTKTLERRIFCRLSDMVLDMCCSLVIPFSIVLPYLRDFDVTIHDFRAELFYNDVWYVNAVAEGRYVVITSMADYISTVVPHVSVLVCLVTIESLIECIPSDSRGSKVAPASLPVKRPTLDEPPQRTSAPLSASGRIRSHHKMHVVVHAAFMLWGAGVAFLHFYAQFNTWTDLPGCKLHVSAWLTRSYPCSFMEVNCYRQGIAGHADEIMSVVQDLDRYALRTFAFTHCPSLHVPPVIQAFRHIGGLEMFNTSIAHWGREAAITQAFHPKLSYVALMHTNATHLPDGLLHTDLPTEFARFGFTKSNLSALPDDIHVHWGNKDWVFLGCEQCELTSVPDSLGRLRIATLVLQANAITTVPASLFESGDGAIGLLDVSRNPLASLPPRIARTTRVVEVQASRTRLRDIPAWLKDWVTDGVLVASTLFDTPFCDALASVANGSVDNILVSELCVDKPTQELPMAIVLPQRQP